MTSYFRLLHNDARHAQLGTSSGDGAVGVAVDQGGGVRHAAGLRPVRGHVLHHMRLLSEGPVAHLAHKRFLSSVDFEMLLEVEPF